MPLLQIVRLDYKYYSRQALLLILVGFTDYFAILSTVLLIVIRLSVIMMSVVAHEKCVGKKVTTGLDGSLGLIVLTGDPYGSIC